MDLHDIPEEPSEETGGFSERSTGLVFAAIAALIAYCNRHDEAVLMASVLVTAVLFSSGMLAPRLLRPLSILWFRLSLLLNRVVTHIVMLIIFISVILPAGTLMRIWYDPLARRKPKISSTYWIERDKKEKVPSSMTDQF